MKQGAMMRTFGTEEEFMFLDRSTLRPQNVSAEVQSLLRGRSQSGSLGTEFVAPGFITPGFITPGFITPELVPPELVHSEFLTSQIEHSSPVFEHLDQAEATLLSFRSRLAAAAAAQDALAAGVGTPFQGSDSPEVTDTVRYRRVEAELRGLVPENLINGLHVHVGIPNRQAGVAALNHVRVWLPVLQALSGNSPFWNGRDTGFTSWRSIHARRWSTAGCPPHFADAADYDRRARSLIGVGGTLDLHTIWWGARLAEKYPTLEVRVCDAQLDTRSSLLLTALTRALVSTALADADRDTAPSRLEPELLDASLWHAARDGVQSNLLDPISGELAPARVVVTALFGAVSDALEEAGDADRVRELLDRFWRLGTGAERQRAAFATGGPRALGVLLRDSVSAAD
ncbi:carboxylate-amine ligase [Cryobacterium psychrophilum]|nr:YbdK family carboxylate-amine ligase [Cryobacterium psychrophilum]